MAVRIRGAEPSAALLFLMPTNERILYERLRARATSAEDFEARLAHWREEKEHASLFDYILPVEGGLDALNTRWAGIWHDLGISLP